MKICLVSEDHRLTECCRELLAALGGEPCELAAAPAAESAPRDGDVYIWDFPPAGRFPDWLAGCASARHIFLIHRGDLTALRDLLPAQAFYVLLKPVHRAALQSYLEQCLRCPDGAERVAFLRNDRDNILECLLEANVRLQEYDQQRTNFLARAVHDFRAPLTALNGYCGLLLSQQLGGLSSRQKEVLERMQHSIKRLTRIATAMLELSAGRLVERRPELEEADIETCVDQALHEIMPLAAEKNLNLTVSLEAPAAPLAFDRSQIEQVLMNLLDNACKFTPKNGAIEVRGFPFFWERRNGRVRDSAAQPERRLAVVRTPNAYRIEVSDTGPGVPEPYLATIFEEYTSYAGSRDRSGGGLGLAICKMILRAHQGDIFAYSSQKGFTFAFVLPYRQPQGSRPAAQLGLSVVAGGRQPDGVRRMAG